MGGPRGVARMRAGRVPRPDRERSRLPHAGVFPLTAGPSLPRVVPERLCGPDEGRLAGGESDPPSVRKPSLAIREVVPWGTGSPGPPPLSVR